MRHPSHFKMLSARDQIDLDGSMALRNSIGEVSALTEQTLAEAQQQGEVDSVHAGRHWRCSRAPRRTAWPECSTMDILVSGV